MILFAHLLLRRYTPLTQQLSSIILSRAGVFVKCIEGHRGETDRGLHSTVLDSTDIRIKAMSLSDQNGYITFSNDQQGI